MLKNTFIRYILDHFKIIIIVLSIMVISILGFITIYYYTYQEDEASSVVVNDGMIADTLTEEKQEEIYYYVDLKGAVSNPNVYKVRTNDRIIDVINMAGLLENADTSVLNLSKKVTDEMVIIIYTKDDIAKFKLQNEKPKEIIKYIELECKCPDPDINDACINKEEEESILVSINNATKEELMTLPGIGETKALDIINYRNTNDGFKTLEDIKNVKGIGDSVFDKIKDFITL